MSTSGNSCFLLAYSFSFFLLFSFAVDLPFRLRGWRFFVSGPYGLVLFWVHVQSQATVFCHPISFGRLLLDPQPPISFHFFPTNASKNFFAPAQFDRNCVLCSLLCWLGMLSLCGPVAFSFYFLPRVSPVFFSHNIVTCPR